MKYVGLDVHKETIHGTVTDGNGRVLKEGRFFNTREGFERFFRSITGAEVAMEAGYGWQPPYELLEGMGHRVKLAHPYETRLQAKKIKTDARDSEKLTQLLRTGMLPEAYAPPKHIRELRDLLYRRTYLVRTQTKFKNKTHAELAKRWIKPEREELFTGPGKSYLRSLHIDAVEDYLVVLEALDEPIKRLSKQIKFLAGESADAKLLMTIPGVGYFSALAMLAEIGDMNRFGSSEELCSYAGLVPSTEGSGEIVRHGKITKQGRKLMRWTLDQCVKIHRKYDTKLTKFWGRMARTKGRKAANVATARKLLKVMYWMLKRRQEYRPEGVKIGKYR